MLYCLVMIAGMQTQTLRPCLRLEYAVCARMQREWWTVYFRDNNPVPRLWIVVRPGELCATWEVVP